MIMDTQDIIMDIQLFFPQDSIKLIILKIL